MKTLLPLILVIVLGSSVAGAAENSTWYSTIGVAQYWLDTHDNGPGGWIAAGYDTGPVSAEIGLTVAPSTGFHSLDAGVNAWLCRQCRIRPFVSAGIGMMGQEDFSGLWLGAGGGLEWPVGRANSLVLTGRVARHVSLGGESFRGPHRIGLAWTHRFGSAR